MKNLFKYTLLFTGLVALGQVHAMDRLPKSVQDKLEAMGLRKARRNLNLGLSLEIPMYPQERLFKGIEKSDVETVEQAIKDGADVNQSIKGLKLTPLQRAVQVGNVAIVEKLLSANAATDVILIDGPKRLSLISLVLMSDQLEEIKCALIDLLTKYGVEAKDTLSADMFLIQSSEVAQSLIKVNGDHVKSKGLMNKVFSMLNTLKKNEAVYQNAKRISKIDINECINLWDKVIQPKQKQMKTLFLAINSLFPNYFRALSDVFAENNLIDKL